SPGVGTTKAGSSKLPSKTPPRQTSPGGTRAAGQAGPPTEGVDPDKQAAVCWQQLFQVVAATPPSAEQQRRVEDYMYARSKLGGKYTTEVRSILKFWPRVINQLKGKPEMEAGYVTLLHALLRLHEAQGSEKLNVPGDITSDLDLITELLGIQRI